MNRVQTAASLALWKGREVRYYRAWQKLVKAKASPVANGARYNAFMAYSQAHTMRVRRQMQLKKFPAASVSHVSSAGAQKIIEREGEIPYAYPDSQGWATAWVGHLIMPMHKGVTAADLKRWGSKNNPAPRSKILSFFINQDLLPYEKVVTDANKKRTANGHRSISQEQFDACASLAFNIGTGGFATSTVARLIANGAAASSVSAAFMKWDQPPEIRGRRQGEADQYARG